MEKNNLSRIRAVTGTLVAASVLSACSVFGRMTTPEPPFKIVRKNPPFELRQYGANMLVETRVNAPYGSGRNKAFSRLFDYISGENESAQEISMTTPVLMECCSSEPESLTGDADRQEGKKATWSMSFFLPENMDASKSPQPNDRELQLVAQDPRLIASIQFSGTFSPNNFEQYEEKLRQWVKEIGYEPAGGIQAAAYNPPWTLPPLRRNELLLAVKQVSEVSN